MKKTRLVLMLILSILLTDNMIIGQPLPYIIKKTSFSTPDYNEFSPVFYKDGIVFCTDRSASLLINYSSSQFKGLFKMYYADTSQKVQIKPASLFSKALTTNFNDGPATFNSTGDTIYFSQNLSTDGRMKDVSGSKNKLGIFYSVLSGVKWSAPRELRINNEWYNVTTPCLSPDGKRLYFASDKPGGFGGSDLYYCDWKSDYWNDPVNMGPVINTKGNESYPFVNSAGELLYSSDGLPGLGGKDIYFSRIKEGNWVTPVHLDAPINSEYDDFGIITDPLFNYGYFSSNRDKSFDIYRFETIFPQTFYSDLQSEFKYCYSFRDTGDLRIDTTELKYRWNFGDNNHAYGLTVSHCYRAAGKYNVSLDIVDASTGKLFFSKMKYLVDLVDYEHPYISSKDVVLKRDSILFDGSQSHFPGYRISAFLWNFGDGVRAKGEKVKHSYNESGEFLVNLELIIESPSGGNIHKTGSTKKIFVQNSNHDLQSFKIPDSGPETELPDFRRSDNSQVTLLYSSAEDLKKDAVFQVELLSSRSKVPLTSSIFHSVPANYPVREVLEPEDSLYHYIVDQQLSLMSCYSAYKRMVAEGFRNVRIKLFLLDDPGERELYNILKIFGNQPDLFFDDNDKFTPTANILLDQIVRILNKYTAMKLEIGVYPTSAAPSPANVRKTREQAQLIVKRLVSGGINSFRLEPIGFDNLSTGIPESSEIKMTLNRRVAFTVIR